MPDAPAQDPATTAAAVIDAQALIGRADTKAGVLLAACVAGVSLAAGTAAALPALARIPAALTAATLAAAAVLLLLVVLPGGGAITPATLTAQPTERLALLCSLLALKMRRIRLAVLVLLAAVLLAALTAAVAPHHSLTRTQQHRSPRAAPCISGGGSGALLRSPALLLFGFAD